MRIEQYFLMTVNALWEVILNGDSPPPTRSVDVNTAHGVSATSSKTNAYNLPNVDSLSDAVEDGLKVADGNVDYESQKIPTENKKEFRECKDSKHQDNMNRKAPRRIVPVEDTTSNDLGSFMPSKPNLVFADEHVVSDSITSLPCITKIEVKSSESKLKNVSALIIEDWVSDSKDENEIETETKQIKPTFAKGNTQQELQEKGVIDSGCSRHMTGNMSYLSEYKEIDGGYVAFGGDHKGGKITDTECVVLSPNFKLLDDSQVLLRVPRKSNMYSADLRNIAPSGGIGPNWMFDMDSLTLSMNYRPVFAGNQTNDNAGPKRLEDEVAANARKKSTEVPRKENEVKDPAKKVTKMINRTILNTVSSPVNAVSSSFTTVNPGREIAQRNELESVFGQDKDANDNRMFTPDTADTGIFDDVYDDREVGVKADTNNLELSTVVSPIPTIRVHKDHPKKQII
nr:hypothetical protein [Tanacetum cinerariifolium]